MKNKILIDPIDKAKGIRSWFAWKLVDLANWIRPGNEAAMSYMMGLIQEFSLEEMLYGRSEFEIKVKKHEPIFEDPNFCTDKDCPIYIKAAGHTKGVAICKYKK